MEIQKINGKIIIGHILGSNEVNSVKGTIAKCERALENPVQEPRVQFIPVPLAFVSIIRHLAVVQAKLQKVYEALDNCILKDIDNPTPEVCLDAVRKNGYELLYIKNPTPELCLEAVKQEAYVIRYIKRENQTVEMALEVVKKEGNLFQYIDSKCQTDEVCFTAIQNSHGWAIGYIENQKPEYCRAALEINDITFSSIRSEFLTQEIIHYAIQTHPSSISHIDNPSEELQLEAVKKDGTAIQYIKGYKSPAVFLAAVTQNPNAFKYIKSKHHTPEMCLIAVKENGFYLNKIQNQTPELCKAAVAQNPLWEKYVKDKSMLQ
ncbi:MAG: DUF4116 domain-containing protein [Prevotellaceae bacterium]|jgi:hypothetical protein|nr:DUF4116 domain-containing protein [Prevotellaceae bacterium]